MISFIDYILEVKHTKRTKRIKRGKAKEPTQPRESDWPPFTPEPPSYTNSLGIAEQEGEPTKPNNPTPLPPSNPPQKKKKPFNSISLFGSGVTGLPSGLPPTSAQGN